MIQRMETKDSSNRSLSTTFLNNKILRSIVFILIVIGILFVAVWVVAFIGSMNNFNTGKEYFHDRQYIRAITFFDRSMHWYAPFNPYIERSSEYLWEISEQAKEVNDEKLSFIAIETIRNSFYSTRSFYSPGTIWIKRCEDRIRDILKNENEEMPNGSDTYVTENVVGQMIAYNDPDTFWTIVLEIGLLSWIGSVICFIFFVLGIKDKSKGFIHSYWFWTLLMVISYSFWVIGIIKA
jgi:hypothetical protein